MLKIVQSPDIELLADDFFQQYQQALSAVFENAQVVVPNLALADWLEQRLARQTGVVAGIDFLLWREFSHQLQDALFAYHYPKAKLPLPLSIGNMRWFLFAYLLSHGQEILADKAHPLSVALQMLFNGVSAEMPFSDTQVQRLWAYAQESAKIFSEYLAMRPDWLEKFAQDERLALADFADAEQLATMPDWLALHYQQVLEAQGFLWQRLFAEQAQAQAALRAQFLQAAQKNALPVEIVPKQIFVFMPNELDAQMLEFLQALAVAREVFVFHHTVSNAHFSDIVDSRWLRRLPLEEQSAGLYSSGHTLVSRFGKLARQRLRLLEQAQLAQEMNLLDPPPRNTARLLGRLQEDIQRLDDEVSLAALPLAEDDDSLQIHACHGVLRQLEVLRGEIVRWLNADSSRRIDDILLLVPDLAAHQDMLRSIFPSDSRYDGYDLPARLTGVATVAVENLWRAVGGIYALAESDFSFSAVKEWLLLPDNCAAYGLSHEEMLYWLDKLAQAGFRRGFDEAHLQEMVEDGDFRFSFCYALDRLVVAYAMPESVLYQERVVPVEAVRGNAFGALSALCRFSAEICQIRAQREKRFSATEALEILRNRLHDGYAQALETPAYQAIDKQIRNVIYQLVGTQEALQALPALPLKFIVRTVEESLSSMQISAEPSGVMTIAELNALQALPYRLIVFLGAEEGAFPAQQQDRRYNLLDISTPRLGDRSRKQEDLAAFLTMLCAAKEACWLFYTAVDLVDNEARLAPAPIQEVLNYVAQYLPEEKIHLQHQGDPFHPEQHQLTHSAPLWQRVRNSMANPAKNSANAWFDWQTYTPIALSNLEQIVPAQRSIKLTQMLQALQKPLQYYLTQQNIALGKALERDNSHEPLLLNELEKWQLRNHCIQSAQDEQQAQIIHALPLLPIGSLGEAEYQETTHKIQYRQQHLSAMAQTQNFPSLSHQEILIADTYISALLPTTANQPWLRLSAGSSKAKYWLDAWLYHLLWQSSSTLPVAEKQGTYINFEHKEIAEGITLYLAPMSATEAQALLTPWIKCYHAMATQLWLFTPDVAIKLFGKESINLETFKKNLKDNEQIAWEFLYAEQASQRIEEILKQSIEVKALYQPLVSILEAQRLIS